MDPVMGESSPVLVLMELRGIRDELNYGIKKC